MNKKYTVPAIEKAHSILQQIAEHNGKLKLMDLSKQLGISKSSIYALLQTMEEHRWVEKDKGDTYSLGAAMAYWGHRYFQKYDLVDLFRKEAPVYKSMIEESIQLAKLERDSVLYLAKESASSPVQMVAGPGVRFPAHATGLGKMLLSGLSREQVNTLLPAPELPAITPYTITDREKLHAELGEIRARGYAYDRQEGVIGFSCVAAPVFNPRGELEAAVSISMPQHHWDSKIEKAQALVMSLAQKLSTGKQL